MSVNASGGMRGSSMGLGELALQIAVLPAFLVSEAAKLNCVMNRSVKWPFKKRCMK